MLDRGLKKGSAELIIPSIVAARGRHGWKTFVHAMGLVTGPDHA
jgi:hypothetical protein